MALDPEAQRRKLIETGYVMSHWPKPWGRDAGAVEQLVIEQEFANTGIRRPAYSITGWVILTLIQHATEDQIARWVPPALRQDVHLVSAVQRTRRRLRCGRHQTRHARRRRVDGEWKKVWTSGAHYSGHGPRHGSTDPSAPKHNGITTMVNDMHRAPGVEVRPIKIAVRNSESTGVLHRRLCARRRRCWSGQRRLDRSRGPRSATRA